MFEKEVVIKCTDSDIEKLVRCHYPQFKNYELYANEDHDNSVMVKNVIAEDVSDYEREDFDDGVGYNMAQVLLDKLCFDGHIEPGKYLIDGTW